MVNQRHNYTPPIQLSPPGLALGVFLPKLLCQDVGIARNQPILGPSRSVCARCTGMPQLPPHSRQFLPVPPACASGLVAPRHAIAGADPVSGRGCVDSVSRLSERPLAAKEPPRIAKLGPVHTPRHPLSNPPPVNGNVPSNVNMEPISVEFRLPPFLNFTFQFFSDSNS